MNGIKMISYFYFRKKNSIFPVRERKGWGIFNSVMFYIAYVPSNLLAFLF